MNSTSWIPADWPAPNNIIAGTTTRYGGVSQTPYDNFNLADHCGDDPVNVQENRKILRKRLWLASEPLWLEQTHSNRCIDAGQRMLFAPKADASFSKEPGVACVILTADCLPILLCDQQGSFVAAIHAGWRGLSSGIIAQTLRNLGNPANCMAWLGPAISQNAYQVGSDVYQALTTYDVSHKEAFLPDGEKHYRLDIYTVARQQLIKAGVTAVYGGNFCTFQQTMFFSYRRDKQTGRMATLILRQHAC